MARSEIEAQARLIAGLAETMNDSMWASDILTRCQQINEAVEIIAREARRREGSER